MFANMLYHENTTFPFYYELYFHNQALNVVHVEKHVNYHWECIECILNDIKHTKNILDDVTSNEKFWYVLYISNST